MKEKKQLSIKMTYFLVAIFIMLVVGMSFALPSFLVTLTGQSINRINSCSLNFNFKEEEGVSLIDTFPMTYSDAQNYEPFKVRLTKTGNCSDISYKLSMESSCNTCEQTDGKCDVNESTCDCNNQIDSALIDYEFVNLKTGEITKGTDPYTLNLSDLLDEGEDIVDYEIRLWINEKATNSDIYISTETTPYTTKDFCAKLKADVYTQAPEYCFVYEYDETNLTASITDYNCYEGNTYGYETITDVAIPMTTSVMPEGKSGYYIDYAAYEDETKVEACTNAFMNMGDWSDASQEEIAEVRSLYQIICSGGNVEGMGLEYFMMEQPELIEQANLVETGVVKELKNYTTFKVVDNPTEDQINKCMIVVTNLGAADSASTICNDSNTLQNLANDDQFGLFFYGTGIVTANMATKKDYSVTSLAGSSFKEKNLTSVVIPDGVTSIGANVFQNNSLTSVTIPDSVTSIGNYAFQNNNITGLALGNSVKTIGTYAFEGNDNLTGNLVIPDSVTSIGNYAFQNNNITGLALGNSVKTIGTYAFCSNNLTSVVIPDGVTTIGDVAFASNNLTSVTIPDSVTKIGASAFASNNLTSVTIPNSVTTIGNSAFQSNNLTSVVIPDSVTTIGSGVFNNNKFSDEDAYIYARTDFNNDGIAEINYTEVIGYGGANKNPIIPTQKNEIELTTIGESAFSHNNLTSVVIPDSVITIGESAFWNNNLTRVEIPDSVTTIGDSAFWSNNLTRVVIPNSVTTIGSHAFGSNYLISVVIGENSNLTESTGIGLFAFLSSVSSNRYLTTIYNNSQKAFDWTGAITGTAGTPFITGTVPSYDSNIVTITTGYPS